MNCPVCDNFLTNPLPEFCPNCNKNLKHDITLIQSLDKVPEETKKRYTKWLSLYRKFFKVKVQLKSIFEEFNEIKEDFKVLKEDTMEDLVEILEFNISSINEINNLINEVEKNYRVVKQVHQVEQSSSRDSIKIQGSNIYNDLISDKYDELNKTKLYLEELNVFDNPKDIFDFKISSVKTFLDNIGNTIVNIETKISLNQDSLKKAKDILKKYKGYLYKNGEVSYLTKKLSVNNFPSYGIRVPVSLVLLDIKGNVLEILEKKHDKSTMYSYFTIYNVSSDKHYQEIFQIPMLDIPEKSSSSTLLWTHRVSNDVLKNLSSVKFIFREKSLVEIGYTEKYDRTGVLYYYQPKGIPVNIKDIEIESFYNKQINQMIELVNSEIEKIDLNQVIYSK